MFSNFLSTDHLNKLLNIIRLLLVIYIAYLAAKVSISVLFPVALTPVSSGAIHLVSPKPVINMTALKNWNLFGAPSSSSTESSDSLHSALATNLQLQLTGVFCAQDPKKSSAVISAPDGEANLYHIGDTLPGDAILDQVYDDKVILKRNGRLEILAFEKTDTGLLESNNSIADKSTYNNAPSLSQLLSPEYNKNQPLAPKELFQAFSSGIQQNPAATFSATGLRSIPMIQGGGYLISAGAPDALIKTTGLQRGDVIKKINGHLLGDVLADRPLFQQLSAQTSVQVELERNSRQLTMTVRVPK